MTIGARKVLMFVGILSGVVTACLGLETQHSNHLGWALLLSGTALTTIGSIYLGTMFLQSGREKNSKDRLLGLPCLGVLLISLVTPLEFLFLPQILPRNDYAQDVGLILFAGGIVFYLVSLHSAEVWESSLMPFSFKQNRPLNAILRVFLCPISASLLLVMFGLWIGYSSLIGLCILLLFVLPGFIYWIKGNARRFNE